MKNLIVILVMAALGWTFFFLWDSPTEFFFRNKKTKIESLPTADSYMNGTKTVKYDEDGYPVYQLAAKTGYYYTTKDSFELVEPILTAQESPLSAEPWKLSADTARSSVKGSHIILEGNIHARQQKGGRANEFFTDNLRFFPEDNLAKTKAKVKLVHHTSIMTGTGMIANFTTEVYRLLADVEGTYHDS